MKAVSHKTPDRVPIMCGRINNMDYFLAHSGCESEAELRRLWGLDLVKTSYSGVFNTKPNRTIWDTDDHSVQGNIPADNIYTMFDESKKILYKMNEFNTYYKP